MHSLSQMLADLALLLAGLIIMSQQVLRSEIRLNNVFIAAD